MLSVIMLAVIKFHFPINPPVSGNPIMDRLAIKKHTIVIGMDFAIPVNSLILFLWTKTIKLPAAKNKVIFAKAWKIICIGAIIWVDEDNKTVANTMYESCEIVEYANLFFKLSCFNAMMEDKIIVIDGII